MKDAIFYAFSVKGVAVKLVMTLLVRDEEDIIAANIDYHLSQGVDFFIVTNNLSVDSTPDILASYEKKKLLCIIKERRDDYSQSIWVTKMAKMAYEEYRADWVINNDADEFWWVEKKGETLKSILEDVDRSVLSLKVERKNFIPPLVNSGSFFARDMVIREVDSYNSLGDPLPAKVCHRAYADVIVSQGNHAVEINGRRVDPSPIEITILHYPLRSYSQFENKIVKGGRAYERNLVLNKSIGGTWRALYEQYLAGTLHEYYLQQTESEEKIKYKLDKGELLVDNRLIDYFNKQLNYRC
jgi:fibrillarin-like rRNA methylase